LLGIRDRQTMLACIGCQLYILETGIYRPRLVWSNSAPPNTLQISFVFGNNCPTID
jgi:hypothetical protein